MRLQQDENQKSKSMSIHKLMDIGLLLTSIYIFVWISIGAYHSYPNVEDLSEAAQSRNIGAFNRLIEAQQIVDGRYTTNLLHGLNPLAFDYYYGYQLMPVVTFCLLFGGLFFLLNSLFQNTIKKNALYSFVFVSLFLGAIDISRSLYFMICSFVYIYPVIFSLFFFGSLIQFFKTKKTVFFILSHLFLFLMIGGNEFSMPIAGSYLIGLGIYFWKDKDKRTTILLFIPTLILSSILFVSSPGVLMRFSHYETHREVISIATLLLTPLKYGFYTFFSLRFIPLFLFIVYFTQCYVKPFSKEIKSLLLQIILAILTIYTIWFVLIFSQGDQGFSPRIIAVPISIGVVVLIFALKRISLDFLNKNYLKLSFLFLIVTFTVFSSSVSLIQKDYFSGKLTLFKKTMDKRYEILTTKSKSSDCLSRKIISDVIPILPESITYSPIKYLQPNREEKSANRSYERYFNIDEVALENDSLIVLNKLNELTKN